MPLPTSGRTADPVAVIRRYAALGRARRVGCPANTAHDKVEYEMVGGVLRTRCCVCHASRLITKDEIAGMQAMIENVESYK
jgi:hypothetical protein